MAKSLDMIVDNKGNLMKVYIHCSNFFFFIMLNDYQLHSNLMDKSKFSAIT